MKLAFRAFKTAKRQQICSDDNNDGVIDMMFPPETCLLTEMQQAMAFKPSSARIVRTPSSTEPRILLFGQRWAWAPLERPWEISAPMPVNQSRDWNNELLGNDVEGYGLFVIDANEALSWEQTGTASDGTEQGLLSIWHLVSSWKGPFESGPYGVYTHKSVIPWPWDEPTFFTPLSESLEIWPAGGQPLWFEPIWKKVTPL